jgi:hypothetical protein
VLSLRTTFRRFQATVKKGVKEPWDDDLSEADIEALASAGWSAATIRAHVEALQSMHAALVAAPHWAHLHDEPEPST